jgi:hypothetical protein
MQQVNRQTNSLESAQLHEQLDLLKIVYIKLLNDKQVLLEWGKPLLEALYNTRIGYLQIEKLQLQLRIKALKRKIEMVHAALNLEEPININEIELEVAAELAETEARIMNEVARLEDSKELLSNLGSAEDSAELRKIYKQLAKQLHPDVNDNLTEEQKNLWHLVKEAYEECDLEMLRSIQLVYEKELAAAQSKTAALTGEEITLKIEVLKEGIKVMNEQLLQIRNEFPFTIESQIKDEEWVSSQTDELKKELDKLVQYESELTLQYQQIISVL